MKLLTYSINLPQPPMSPAKDPGDYPAFSGAISRWAWRIYTQRLTPAGRWFALLSGAFVSYSGASIQLQGYVPAAYVGAVWLVAGLGLMVKPRVRAGWTVQDRVTAGGELGAEVEVRNVRRFGGGADLVVVPHRLPRSMDCVPDMGVTLPDLSPGEMVKAKLKIKCSKRGQFELRGFRVESGFPFGILRSRRTVAEKRKVTVVPAFKPLTRLTLPTGRRYQPGGVALASQLGESFEYLGNREYREGDNVRDIDWRATARVGVPVVREWVEEYMLRVAVVLDTHVEQGQPKKKLAASREGLERAVSMAAAVSDYMARQDYLVDLFAAGPDLYHLTAGRSLAYLDQILEILACVEESKTATFGQIGPKLAELLERLSTVILVLTRWDEPRRAFAEELAGQGVAVKVIVVTDEPVEVGGSKAVGEVAVVTSAMFEKGVLEI